MPFAAAYWHVYRHQLARTGQFGPLDLRSLPCQVLLARYVCDSKNVCWESIGQRWAFAIPGRPVAAPGLVASKSVTVGCVCMACQVPNEVVFSLRAVKTQLLQSCHPVVAKWLAESLQPVLPPQSNYTPRWNHIRACRYWCQSHWFDMSPAELQLTSQDAQAVLENANLGAHRNSREACRVQTAFLDPLPAGNCPCRMGA